MKDKQDEIDDAEQIPRTVVAKSKKVKKDAIGKKDGKMEQLLETKARVRLAALAAQPLALSPGEVRALASLLGCVEEVNKGAILTELDKPRKKYKNDQKGSNNSTSPPAYASIYFLYI
jgi:hypothetical protein